jgi:zinc protease
LRVSDRSLKGCVWLLTWIAAALVVRVAAAQGTGIRLSAIRPEHFRLQNGLEVVIQREPRQAVVATVMSYEIGRRDDPPGSEGLAHLIEHLSYSGSRHLPRLGALTELVNAGSPSFNGVTGPDFTFYFSVVDSTRVALPLWLESERLGFTLERVDEAALAHERKIIRKEMLGVRDRQRWLLPVLRTQYPQGHPYHTPEDPSAGTDSVELSSVLGHFQRAYRPDNARLVIVGGIDTSRTTELVHRYFEPVTNPPRKLARRFAKQRVFPGRETLVVEDYIYTGRNLVMVWPAPTAASPDWIPYRAIVQQLGGTGAGSLSAYLVDQYRLAATVHVELDTNDLDASLMITADLGVDQRTSFEQVELAIEGLLANFSRVEPTAAELSRLRATATLQLLAQFEDVQKRAFLHLQSLRRTGRPYALADELTRWSSLRPESISDVARRYLDPRRRLSARLRESKGWVPTGGRISYTVERAP